MAEYKAPVDDIAFTLNHLIHFEKLAQGNAFEDASSDLIEPILTEAAKIAEREIAPLNWSGDQTGCAIDENGNVSASEGFKEAYSEFVTAGWPSLQFNPAYGGQGLPFVLSLAVMEMVQSANTAWSLCPLLTQGAIHAIELNANDSLKKQYLPKMVSGEWSGTMNLTEAQAGSDLALIKTSATHHGDHYLIKGQKIFITWGDHDMTDNVVHLVLARLPDAPAGVKGISLFIVPKFLVNEDGSLGAQNDCKVISLEHKLGIHASPTCVMSYGDNDGAIAYLVGEENRGLACMFTMMNNARLMVGLQGTSIAERAQQDAIDFASQLMQGNRPGQTETCSIDQHPDVKRMLMTMRALTQASRALVYLGCSGNDFEKAASTSEEGKAISSRTSLLTPIVKGWATEVAQEVCYIAVQVHGGMGFIEETGVAQHSRDARILSIYEGTTGIQAIDLIGRKTLYDQGAAINALLTEIHSDIVRIQSIDALNQHGLAVAKSATKLGETVDQLGRLATDNPDVALTIAHDFLFLSGYVCAAWQMLLTLEICHQRAQQLSPATLDTQRMNADYFLRFLHPRYLSFAASIDAAIEMAVAS